MLADERRALVGVSRTDAAARRVGERDFPPGAAPSALHALRGAARRQHGVLQVRHHVVHVRCDGHYIIIIIMIIIIMIKMAVW